MSDTQQYWNKKIARYSKQSWAQLPSLFLDEITSYLPSGGAVLELGCGMGNDGLWLSNNGFSVTQADIGDFRRSDAKQIPFVQLDMNQSLKLSQSFDVIYAHLSLHYFSKQRTTELFKELKAQLNLGGILAFIVNSKDDPEYGTGMQIEDDYFEIDGQPKRFFDVESAGGYCNGMEIVLADNNGGGHKDNAKGTKDLVRIVCRKKL